MEPWLLAVTQSIAQIKLRPRLPCYQPPVVMKDRGAGTWAVKWRHYEN